MDLKNTQDLPEEVKKSLIPFVNDFLALHQDNIISIFVYGSSTGRNFIPKVSDINMMVVVKDVSLDVLQRSLKLISSVKRKRIQAPLILTEDHICSSLDVFPIEFLDMKENHVLIYGKDILSDLVIEGEYVRLFCEQQIKGKLIRIRQAYLEVGFKKKGIEAILKESLTSLMPIFRRLIGLSGLEVPMDKEDLFRKVHEVFGIDTQVMVAIWKDKRNDERIDGKDVRDVFGKYIAELESLARAVDQL